MPARVLIVTDADVRGLLACAAAAREHGPGQAVWLPPGADPALLGTCLEAVRSQAAHWEHSVIEPKAGLSSAISGPDVAPPGHLQSRLLLDAAYLAMSEGIGTVIWAGTSAWHRDNLDLDSLTALHSRALLIERLVALDAAARPAEGGGAVRIEAPYADLSDRQLADLVLDMDLPIWTCWWWSLARGPRNVPGGGGAGGGTEIARAEYERWDVLLREAGWQEGIPSPVTVGQSQGALPQRG